MQGDKNGLEYNNKTFISTKPRHRKAKQLLQKNEEEIMFFFSIIGHYFGIILNL